MEGRCYICGLLRSVLRGVYSRVGTMKVCSGCESAVDRVAALEQREQSLIRVLSQIGRDNDALRDVVFGAIGRSSAGESRRVEAQLRALRAFVSATDISQGGYSGHTLEPLQKPGEPVQWVCVMPGCAVCAAHTMALNVLSGEVNG